jgi:hypothetical protein
MERRRRRDIKRDEKREEGIKDEDKVARCTEKSRRF